MDVVRVQFQDESTLIRVVVDTLPSLVNQSVQKIIEQTVCCAR